MASTQTRNKAFSLKSKPRCPFNVIVPTIGPDYYLNKWNKHSDDEIKSEPELSILFDFITDSLKSYLLAIQADKPEPLCSINQEFEFHKSTRKIFDQCLITQLHISKMVNKEDWLLDIQDYIVYNCESFGYPSTGEQSYLESLKFYLNRCGPICNDWVARRQQILDFIDEKINAQGISDDPILPSLVTLIDEWLNSIPELPFLLNSEEHYEEIKTNLLAACAQEDYRINRYSNTPYSITFSKNRLADILNQLTEFITNKCGIVCLYENGLLDDHQKMEVTLLIAHRKKQMKTAQSKYSNTTYPSYEFMWRNWLKQERKFHKKLKVLFDAGPAKSTDRTNNVIGKLRQYGFEDFLKNAGIPASGIHELIERNSGRGVVPYCIALLSEIGFLKKFYKDFCKNKADGHKKLALVFDSQERRIKGNVNILNPTSSEDSTQYTSVKYKEQVLNDLKGLK